VITLTKAEKFLKRVAVELGYEAALESARGYLLERLKDCTADDVYTAFCNKTSLMNVINDRDKKFGRKMVRRFKKFTYQGKKPKELVTSELILRWLTEDGRADISSLILNLGKPGLEWFEKYVVKPVRDFLWPES